METLIDFFEVGTEFLNIMQMNFMLQLSNFFNLLLTLNNSLLMSLRSPLRNALPSLQQTYERALLLGNLHSWKHLFFLVKYSVFHYSPTTIFLSLSLVHASKG
jgi:hypothetical protein